MHNTILIVDDMEINREILRDMLEDQYDVIEAEDGLAAIDILEKHKDEIVCVCLDLLMPELDGRQVLGMMRQKGILNEIPVLIITAETGNHVEEECLELGANDFITKPFDHSIVLRRIANVTELYRYKNNLESLVDEQHAKLEVQNALLQAQNAQLEVVNEKTIEMLGNVIEARDEESGEHVKRVKGFTRLLGNMFIRLYPECGFDQHDLDLVVKVSPLHDLGKIKISDSILLKKGRLTDEEFMEMKKHTSYGWELMQTMNGIWNEEYAQVAGSVCRYHHERYDGRGYPDHLTGDEIPVGAQLVSLADVYDALVNKRVYKKAYPKDVAYHMIMDGECGTFNPKILECFRLTRIDMEELAEQTQSIV